MSIELEEVTIKLCGNPSTISAVLNKIDPENANTIYLRSCVDGYHFEDVTATVSIDERSEMTLLNVTVSNVRGSLETSYSSIDVVASILQAMASIQQR